MKLDETTRAHLESLSLEQVHALENLKEKLLLQWASTTVKKDTEFETIWNVASREAKHQGLVEFIQYLYNPRK